MGQTTDVAQDKKPVKAKREVIITEIKNITGARVVINKRGSRTLYIDVGGQPVYKFKLSNIKKEM